MREIFGLLRAGGLSPRRSLAPIAVISLVGVAFEAGAMAVAVSIFGVLFEEGDGRSIVILGSELSAVTACAVGIGAALFSAVSDYLVGRRTAAISATYLAGLRKRLAVSAAEASSFAQSEVGGGRLEVLMTSVAYQASLLPMRAATMASSGSAAATLVVAAFVIEPAAAAALTVAGLLLNLAMRPVRRLTSAATDRHTDEQGRLASAVSAWASRLRSARAFGVDGPATEQVLEHTIETSSALRSLRAMAFSGVVVYRTMTIILLIVLVTFASALRPVDALDVTLVLLVVLRALSYSQQLNAARQVAFEAVGPARELIRVCEHLSAERRPSGSERLNRPCGIELNSVSVEIDGQPVLSGVSLQIAPGERVALVGPSGAGKSMLLDVVAGLRVASEGTVEIGGVDVARIESGELAGAVAYVTQDPCIIDGSLSGNVRFFRPGLGEEDIRQSIRQVGLANSELAQRESVGGVRSGLSGGQAQRVELARGLAGQPSVLLLDEPTSALDAEAESVVIESLSELPDSVTILLVTHRPSPLAVCNRFVGIDATGVRELSSRDEADQYCRLIAQEERGESV